MTVSARWKTTVVMMLACLAPGISLAAQAPIWRVSGTASQIWFGSAATDTSLGDLSARPTATIGWGISGERAFGRIRAGLGLTYTSSDLEVYGPGASLIDREGFMRQFEIAALVSYPLIRLGTGGAEFLVMGGPIIGIWSLPEEPSRTTFGGLAALQLAAPISGGWRLLASFGGSLSGSPLAASTLPPEFETTSLWTTRVGVGAQYGF